ncbi:hypothetical protein GF359_09640 [candidate division WOR-3 bacterium]|uniref:DUF1573 domain-containing protein n=1 Tax=candidate division WOR-3 bacterium TaxID=2052148 RepID=A0A9D5KAM8_UNCW3|nr:hypothetical protein [candidate division WOR-3 bacterium]MBD3365461.1 hypothetical protein [candidate division WOR-3 bacterium]
MVKRILLITLATIMVTGGLAFECDDDNEESDLENISIEAAGDTVKSVSAGETGEFDFKVLNHTEQAESLTVDVPDGLNELPESWMWQICIKDACIMPGNPATVEVPASGSYDELYMHVITDDEGTEGKVTIEVTGIGTEADSLTFILNIE